MRRRLVLLACAAGSMVGALSTAESARADGAVVLRLGPEAGCQFGPTDVPGVPVAIPANCLIVITPSGNANVLVRGQLPTGFTLTDTFTAVQPCGFPGLGLGSGRLVATRSGQITAHCHIHP
jgi:hypothetical protein